MLQLKALVWALWGFQLMWMDLRWLIVKPYLFVQTPYASSTNAMLKLSRRKRNKFLDAASANISLEFKDIHVDNASNRQMIYYVHSMVFASSTFHDEYGHWSNNEMYWKWKTSLQMEMDQENPSPKHHKICNKHESELENQFKDDHGREMDHELMK